MSLLEQIGALGEPKPGPYYGCPRCPCGGRVYDWIDSERRGLQMFVDDVATCPYCHVPAVREDVLLESRAS